MYLGIWIMWCAMENIEQDYNYKKYADIIDEILRTLIEKGKGLELNTAGLKYGLPLRIPMQMY